MKKYGLFLSALLLTSACFPDGFRGSASTGVGPVRINYTTDLSTSLVLGTTAALIACKIGYDLSWQSTYVTKTNNWYEMLICAVERNQITSINHPKLQSLFSTIDHDEILQMHIWVKNSYNNWLTPWNWTTALKLSFQNLKIIEILTLYADLFKQEENITGTAIVRAFRCKYGNISVYPLIFAYETIDAHIQFIRSLNNHSLEKLLSQTIDPLNNIKVLLRQENEYNTEVQTKRTNDLQQEMINAIHASGSRY